MSANFIHLRFHSSYSLLEGAISVNKTPDLCFENKMPALALTDTNNMFGALEFSETLSKKGIQPIVGLQIDLCLKDYFKNKKINFAPSAPIILLVKSQKGYQNLLKIASNAYIKNSLKDGIPVTNLEDLCQFHEDLILLSGGQLGPFGYLISQKKQTELDQILKKLHDCYADRFYIELQRVGRTDEAAFEDQFLTIAYDHNIGIVATNDVMFIREDMAMAHDALICIAEGRYLVEDDRRKVSKEQYFKSSQQMEALFSDLPEAIENTKIIAQRCAFKAETHPPILPPFVQGGDFDDEVKALKAQAKAGLEKRLSKNELFADRQAYMDRLDFELDVICKMKFPGYFLIVSDFIGWAKGKNIPVGPGRGSGAGSVVAWALDITDLDPLRFGLLFERFLNPERVSMPDFDIDFCQERREEVIEYVQKHYGKDHVAQIITFGKLQARAVIRDVGRVMQIPYGQVDRLCKMVPNNPAQPTSIPEALESEEAFAQAKNEDESISHMLDIAIDLEGLYRHASTHAAGVVIGDRPLDQLVPLYRDPKSDMPVTQFNMKWVEPAGLVKFDFLGLKTLTVIQKAISLLRNRDINIVASDLDLMDKPTFDMLSTGETTGVFQLESTGMRDVLRKMRPDCLEDIIALVALYRPGPMDNIPNYIAVKKGEQKVDYLHPSLKETLTETYGVIIYQEQVMQIAQILSGYSLGEADLLRRAMGKKIKAEMDQQRIRFVEGAKEKNVPEKQSGSIFDLVAKFAGYGFNKSHAAAYAFVSYQTAYIKTHYPTEFMSATMSYDMQNTDKLAIDIQEVKRLNINLAPPCVNQSRADFSVRDNKIYYALSAIKNVGEAAMESLEAERNKKGAFKDVFDFARRNNSNVMNKRTLEFLIKAGALDIFTKNRRQLLDSIDLLVGLSSSTQQDKAGGQNSLFAGDDDFSNNITLADISDNSPIDRLSHEHNALGFYLTSHPLETMKDILQEAYIIPHAQLMQKAEIENTHAKISGIISAKTMRKSAKGTRYAFLGLSDLSGGYEVVLFSDQIEQYKDILNIGEIVSLSAEAYKDNTDQTRIKIHHICKISDLNANKLKHYHVTLSKQGAISDLAKTLNKKGVHKVSLHVRHQKSKQNITIDLGERYHIPSDNTLKDIKDVESVTIKEL